MHWHKKSVVKNFMQILIYFFLFSLFRTMAKFYAHITDSLFSKNCKHFFPVDAKYQLMTSKSNRPIKFIILGIIKGRTLLTTTDVERKLKEVCDEKV